MQNTSKETLVVAGASGFIGRQLPEVISDRYRLIGLSRDPEWSARQPWGDGYVWRRCDLFSRRETFDALSDAHRAVYLVHSMNPSTRLRQGYVRDLDVICADNFARAARHHELDLVVNLTQLPVDEKGKSHFLASRREVDATLRSYGTAVTTIRAGLVVGPGGSATEMIQNLVRRLPVMGLPRWVEATCAPIARGDLVALIGFAVEHTDLAGHSYDVAGPHNYTFRQLLEMAAELMGRRRIYISLPVETPFLSTLWVSVFGGHRQTVVRPLVESFRYGLEPGDTQLQALANQKPSSIRDALDRALQQPAPSTELIEKKGAPHSTALMRQRNEVRSIQRLRLPDGRDARWVAREYARWLPRFMAPFIDVKTEDEMLLFVLRPLPWPLLILELDEDVSNPDRQLYWIRGGLLAGREQEGRLEFRQVFDPTVVLAAIHQFRPRLPWVIYRNTQALVHRFVMYFYGRYLRKIAGELPPADGEPQQLGSEVAKEC